MLLTVKSIRIKRMNVEIFCERGVRKGVGACGIVFGAFAGCKGRSQGVRGVRWGVGTFVRAQGAWGIVLGAFARARNACMIFSQQT